MINFSFAVKTSGYLNTSFGLQQRKLLNLPCEYPVPNTLQHGVGRTQNYQSFLFFYAFVELNPLGAENLPKCWVKILRTLSLWPSHPSFNPSVDFLSLKFVTNLPVLHVTQSLLIISLFFFSQWWTWIILTPPFLEKKARNHL